MLDPVLVTGKLRVAGPEIPLLYFALLFIHDIFTGELRVYDPELPLLFFALLLLYLTHK